MVFIPIDYLDIYKAQYSKVKLVELFCCCLVSFTLSDLSPIRSYQRNTIPKIVHNCH